MVSYIAEMLVLLLTGFLSFFLISLLTLLHRYLQVFIFFTLSWVVLYANCEACRLMYSS